MISLATGDCIGTEVVGNKLRRGNSRLVSGKAKPALAGDNEASPLGPAPRPTPKTPSTYQWQLRHTEGN